MFRKIFTRLCQLPGIILPIAAVGALAWCCIGQLSAIVTVWILIVTLCITFACGALIKFIYYKERPTPQHYANWWRKIDASSFPSIHTAYATVFLCTSIFLGYQIYETNMVASVFIVIGGAIFYTLIAASRVVLKKHFFIDIVFGTLLWLVAVAFAWWHLPAILAALDVLF